MHRKICNFISVLCSFVRFSFLKILHFNGFSFKGIQRFSPNVSVEIERGGNMVLGNRVRAHSNVKIKVRKNAKLIIGDNVSFNYGCIVVCRNIINIEKGVEFGPNVLIFDHDHDFRCSGGIKEGKFKCSPITIGENTWIGANTVILRGTKIGEDCVIGAGSIIKKDIPAGTVVIQKHSM